jgi:hypothetical protein
MQDDAPPVADRIRIPVRTLIARQIQQIRAGKAVWRRPLADVTTRPSSTPDSAEVTP